jgi:hypothetical protein
MRKIIEYCLISASCIVLEISSRSRITWTTPISGGEGDALASGILQRFDSAVGASVPEGIGRAGYLG